MSIKITVIHPGFGQRFDQIGSKAFVYLRSRKRDPDNIDVTYVDPRTDPQTRDYARAVIEVAFTPGDKGQMLAANLAKAVESIVGPGTSYSYHHGLYVGTPEEIEAYKAHACHPNIVT